MLLDSIISCCQVEGPNVILFDGGEMLHSRFCGALQDPVLNWFIYPFMATTILDSPLKNDKKKRHANSSSRVMQTRVRIHRPGLEKHVLASTEKLRNRGVTIQPHSRFMAVLPDSLSTALTADCNVWI